MAYVLNGITLRAPHNLSESNSTQLAQNRTLDGSVNRDYFGSNKRTWILEYQNTKKADYDTIKAIYDTYLSTATAIAWAITEASYTVSSTNVHVDLVERSFPIKGTDYLSDFTLTLTEA